MFKEFKEFVMRGNVLDLAIGIVLGAAFGKIVSSLVADVLMPPLGMVMGKLDFSNFFISLNGETYASLKAAKDAGAATINYGLFINNVLDFLIAAFIVFLLVRAVNRLRRKTDVTPTEPTTRECPFCCSTIAIKAARCPQCTSTLAEAETAVNSTASNA